MKIPSPTMKQSVGDRHMINISPTRHKFRPPKIARRRKSSSGHWLSSWMNKEEEKEVVVDMDTHHPPHPALFDIMTHSNVNTTTSPYYKGLTDQSLAVLDQISSSSSSVPPSSIRPHPHPHPLLLSSGYSPYYKGLTDFSLVVDAAAASSSSSNWTPSHPHPHPHHNHNSSSTLSTSTSTSSPYYRGLIDYSLALALRPPPPNSSSSSSLCPVIKEKLTPPPPPPPQPTDDQPMETDQPEPEEATFELMTQEVHHEGKPLSVCVNNESEATLSLEEEMELVTQDVVVVEGKPLSVDNHESEAIQVETVQVVLEQNVEKTISDHRIEENKEKPLRETRVSDLEVETTIFPENNAEKADLDLEEMELVIEQEKPLTLGEVENVVVLQEDQITEKTDLELVEEEEEEEEEVRDCGEKAASEQTVASELPCEDDEHKLKLKEMADDDHEEGNVYQYLWATKYQPKTLEEFI